MRHLLLSELALDGKSRGASDLVGRGLVGRMVGVIAGVRDGVDRCYPVCGAIRSVRASRSPPVRLPRGRRVRAKRT
jgi:hypothetical protein